MLHLPLRIVKFILDELEKNFDSYSYTECYINELGKVILIEDTLALYIGICEEYSTVCLNANEIYKWTINNEFMDMPVNDGKYYTLHIEELTYNTIDFKYNHSKFIRDMEQKTNIQHLSLDIDYSKFRGYTRIYWCPEKPTLAESINNIIPELKLKDRYELWEGIQYFFIVIELIDKKGNKEYAIAFTTQKPNKYMNKLCKSIINGNGFNGDIRALNGDFYKLYKSLNGIKREQRVENHLKYFYFDKYFREKDDVWRYADKVLLNVKNVEYDAEERSSYKIPVNRWVSEEQVYNIVKKLFKEYNVYYQYRPFYLISSIGGQMSYDIFISKLNIAIEYQGKQHFEPIEYFGGEEAYKRTVKRDKEKLELSKKNDITLVYVNYWEDISVDLIREKLANFLNPRK